jgi:uncharacterized protein (TIGR03435 family)
MKASLATVLILAARAVHAQTPPAFEVTSVKVNKQPPRERHLEFGCSPNGRFVSLGEDLRVPFFWAFNVKPFQVSGLPGWIDAPDAIFDIETRAAGDISEDQCRLMVRTLLADRFKLAVSRSTKEILAYVLTAAKNGPKMRRVNPNDEPKPGGGVRIMGNPVGVPPGQAPFQGWSMEQLANFLTGQPSLDGRPVVDRTGLTGIYEINLDYAFRAGFAGEKPEIFTAVQEQLGLKLDSVKATFDVLVVDRLEKPDAN